MELAPEQSRGWSIDRSRSSIAQRLVRALVVVGVPEVVEDGLLTPAVRCSGPSGFTFESSMHSFVSAVVLRARRRNALMHDSQAHPPDVELGEAVQTYGRKRCTVVGANGSRQAVLTEEPLETGSGLHLLGRQQSVAAE